MSKRKTTKKDFTLFCEEAGKWIERYGLVDYNIIFKHEKLNRGRGQCTSNCYSRYGVLSLGTSWDGEYDEITDENVRLVAFHEVWELLLAELRYHGDSREVDPEETDKAIHKLIRVMENVHFHE